jgi:hypothetical protein
MSTAVFDSPRDFEPRCLRDHHPAISVHGIAATARVRFAKWLDGAVALLRGGIVIGFAA